MKTRLDWLEEQLDREDISDATRTSYEKEANKLALAATAAQLARRAKDVELQAKVSDIKTLYEGGSLRELVRLHGGEFIEDYETIQEGKDFVVYSAVAPDWTNSRWVCASAQDAGDKVIQLLGWRVYHHYVRDGA